MTKPLVIAGTTDDRFCMGLCVMVVSVTMHTEINAIDFYLIDAGISAQNRQKISETMIRHNIQLYWLTPNQGLFESVPISGHISIASYYRLSLASLLPQQVSRVIYLDADMLVVDDIAKIWSLGPPCDVLRAVSDPTIRTVSHPSGLKNYQMLGLSADQAYFNAGLLDINLNQWRSRDITSKVFQYLQENLEHIRWHDQDILNGVLAGQWEELPSRWNRPITIYRFENWQESPYSESEFQDLLQNPAVIHFTESGKPWTPGFKHPERYLFFKYLKSTAWNSLWVHTVLMGQRLKARVRRWLKPVTFFARRA